MSADFFSNVIVGVPLKDCCVVEETEREEARYDERTGRPTAPVKIKERKVTVLGVPVPDDSDRVKWPPHAWFDEDNLPREHLGFKIHQGSPGKKIENCVFGFDPYENDDDDHTSSMSVDLLWEKVTLFRQFLIGKGYEGDNIQIYHVRGWC